MIYILLNMFENVKMQGFREEENEDAWFSLAKYKGLEFDTQVEHGVQLKPLKSPKKSETI